MWLSEAEYRPIDFRRPKALRSCDCIYEVYTDLFFGSVVLITRIADRRLRTPNSSGRCGPARSRAWLNAPHALSGRSFSRDDWPISSRSRVGLAGIETQSACPPTPITADGAGRACRERRDRSSGSVHSAASANRARLRNIRSTPAMPTRSMSTSRIASGSSGNTTVA